MICLHHDHSCVYALQLLPIHIAKNNINTAQDSDDIADLVPTQQLRQHLEVDEGRRRAASPDRDTRIHR